MNLCRPFVNTVSYNLKNIFNKPLVSSIKQFHSSGAVRGWEEFKDQLGKEEVMKTGRAWTTADLRRKSFDDIHKLWYVLYKERNLLLSARNKLRTAQKPIPTLEENRYINVKRSMAAIKQTLDERKKIDALLKEQAEAAVLAAENTATGELAAK